MTNQLQHNYQNQSQNQIQGGQSEIYNSLSGIGKTEHMLAFEQQLRILPSLPLNAEERNMIMRAIQQCIQRTSSQSR